MKGVHRLAAPRAPSIQVHAVHPVRARMQEGETRDAGVLALRGRQMRNLMLALMTSQGTPMVLMGARPPGPGRPVLVLRAPALSTTAAPGHHPGSNRTG